MQDLTQAPMNIGKELSEMSTDQTQLRAPSRLASVLAGKLVIPEHAGFDEARRAFNLAIDQRPAAVVFPESPQDVAAAVLFAREFDLRVAAQGTGHNAGPLGSLEDAILLKTERMRGVSIDPARRTARVEAGTLWLEVVEAAAQHGLAALAGSSPNVGVVGYTLGGGISFLARKYGLAANHVRAVELVTADGRRVRADREHEPDLFWALRGGGGSFGVVTAIEFELFPITHAYAGILWYPIERGPEVLHAWRELTHSEQLPDELTTIGRFLNLPPLPEIPEPVRGKSFAVVEVYHLGDPADADHLLAPLRALGPSNDTITTVPMTALHPIHMDPEQPVPYDGDGLLVDHLSTDALDAFAEAAGANAQSHSCRSSCATSAESWAVRDPSTVPLPRSTRTTSCSPSASCPRPSSKRPCAPKCRPSRPHLRAGQRATCTSTSPRHSKTLRRSGPNRPTTAYAASKTPSTPTT